MFYASKLKQIKDFSYNNTELRSFVYNTQNGLFNVLRPMFNSLTSLLEKSVSNVYGSSDVLFFSLLSVYVAFAICEILFGYKLITIGYSEEELFLEITNKESRDYQIQANKFVSNIKVIMSLLLFL